MSVGFFSLFYLTNGLLFDGILHRLFPVIVAFSFGQSILVYFVLREGEKAKWESPIYALGTVTLRLISGLFFMIFMVVLEVPDMRSLLVQFALIYLVYLVFEITYLLANLRRN